MLGEGNYTFNFNPVSSKTEQNWEQRQHNARVELHETRGEREEGRDVHNDVVDRDVNELHKEPNEPHDSKPNCGRHGNTLELCGKSRQMVHMAPTN